MTSHRRVRSHDTGRRAQHHRTEAVEVEDVDEGHSADDHQGEREIDLMELIDVCEEVQRGKLLMEAQPRVQVSTYTMHRMITELQACTGFTEYWLDPDALASILAACSRPEATSREGGRSVIRKTADAIGERNIAIVAIYDKHYFAMRFRRDQNTLEVFNSLQNYHRMKEDHIVSQVQNWIYTMYPLESLPTGIPVTRNDLRSLVDHGAMFVHSSLIDTRPRRRITL
jgi:hypothetical protein